MARKRSSKQATTEATLAENGQAKATPSKKEAVAEALAQGIDSPMEIAEHVTKTYGLEITTNYVSVIKGELKKKKKAKGRKPGRPPRAAKATAQQPTAKPVPAAKEGGLTPQDLRALTELASRAGGFGRLREFIDVLGDVR
jgi:hypothetical protein